MTSAVRKLLDEVLNLPEGERIELASEILASVDGPPDGDWETAWSAELDRRVEAARQRSEPASDWLSARARILAGLGGG